MESTKNQNKTNDENKKEKKKTVPKDDKSKAIKKKENYTKCQECSKKKFSQNIGKCMNTECKRNKEESKKEEPLVP